MRLELVWWSIQDSNSQRWQRGRTKFVAEFPWGNTLLQGRRVDTIGSKAVVRFIFRLPTLIIDNQASSKFEA